MSFLTIPSQEGLFTTITTGKSAKEAESRSPTYDENNDDDDDDEDEDDTEGTRLIPRCSPVPRKRGASIFDETAEYMRIHQALLGEKRVSFADTTGGELLDVKEFVAFDSDDEENARWEEEEAKYRKPEREPTYQVRPEFSVPACGDLLEAVHANKVELEQISPLENEPLAFSGLIRVLNISFNKAVYVRSTMDNWVTYFDHPAEYVQGSHDGTSDKFSFKLSFAPPYTVHGSRIEFVIRYETSDGDFWANNSSMNYAVTLLLSYEDDSAPAYVDTTQIKSILKPPKVYSMNDDLDSEEEEEAGASTPGLIRPTPVCPVIIQPEIDVEIAVRPAGPPAPPNQELPSADGTPSAHTVSPGERFPCMSSETTLQNNSTAGLGASESVQPNKSQPLPRLHCELANRTSEQPIDSSPSALPPFLQQESKQRSDSSPAGKEEIPPSQASCKHPPTTETNLWPTGEDRSTESPDSQELFAPSVTHGSEPEVALGLSEFVAGLPEEGPKRSAAHWEESSPVLLPPVAELQPLGAEGESPPPPELTEDVSVTADVTEASQNPALQSVMAREEKEDAPQVSPDTLLENLSNTLSEDSEPQPEHDVDRNLMPSVIFLSGVVSLSIVMQEPSALFAIGLLLVLHRL